jgi:HD domain
MCNKINYAEILDGLLIQIEGYSKVFRKNIEPYILELLKSKYPSEQFDFEDEVIRESLIEHVGSLPVIASFLHPYLDHKVDLGKVLTILAIHDIGEIKLGDESTFTKLKSKENEEFETGLSLLHSNYHDLYKEEFELKTLEAKFAKSIDKIAPDILDYVVGENYTIERVSFQANWKREEVMQNIRDKKRPFMLWSSFMTNIHDELFSRYKIKTNPN